ncbi:MAG: type II toxin-antitoxin system VapC family toxin [Methylovulum sp.]|nr:type II toxin-antitoxin system VapC family toxin [Methylovulum sp.]
MVYLDTNVLIHAAVEQAADKKAHSIALLEDCIMQNQLLISILVLQEYVFTLAKLKVDAKVIAQDVQFYSEFAHPIPKQVFWYSCILCAKINFFRSINDVVHLMFAQQHCDKLITFDEDFQKLQPYTKVTIEILK